MTTMPPEESSPRNCDVLRELREYLQTSNEWRPLLNNAASTVATRTWSDETVDMVAITGDDISVERTNAEGVPVWRPVGTVAEKYAALRELPDPSSPDAPRTPMRAEDPRRG